MDVLLTQRTARAGLKILLGLAMALAVGLAMASDKRGVGLKDRTGAPQLQALKVSWYYTWTPQPMDDPVSAKFVPMVWGGRWLNSQISALQGKPVAPELLALNEPDQVGQSNMSVQDAVAAWPALSQLGTRISSPATSAPLGGWALSFEKRAKASNLRTDFVAIHIYGPPDPQKFLQRLDAAYKHYRKPIWITEFAVADWSAREAGTNRYSEEQVMAFMKAVIPELEKRSYVERYAWFGAGRGSGKEAVRTSRLVDNRGALTPLGRLYASF